jgi:heat shock protein HslJ
MKLISVISLALLACQTHGDGPSAKETEPALSVAVVAKIANDTTSLAGSWYLQPVLPSDTAAGKTPVLQLDLAKSRFAGNTGCNPMHGQFWYSNTDSSISFSDKMVTTRMACPGYNEPAFLKSLKNTTHYRLQDGVLTLLSDEKAELSRWMRKPAHGPKALKA